MLGVQTCIRAWLQPCQHLDRSRSALAAACGHPKTQFRSRGRSRRSAHVLRDLVHLGQETHSAVRSIRRPVSENSLRVPRAEQIPSARIRSHARPFSLNSHGRMRDDNRAGGSVHQRWVCLSRGEGTRSQRSVLAERLFGDSHPGRERISASGALHSQQPRGSSSCAGRHGVSTFIRALRIRA